MRSKDKGMARWSREEATLGKEEYRSRRDKKTQRTNSRHERRKEERKP